MKKRLRKKKYVGEFSMYCCTIDAEWNDFSKSENDKNDGWNLLGQYICRYIDYIESMKLVSGGGVDEKTFSMCISHGDRYKSPTNEDIKKIKDWMESTGWFKNIKIGPWENAWGPNTKHNYKG